MTLEVGGHIQNTAVRKFIDDMIQSGETILATLLGLGEKTNIGRLFGEKAGAALGGDYLIVTNQRVVIVKSGVGTWATGAFGVKSKSVQYDHVTSVDVTKGLIFGEIEVMAAGMIEKSTGGFFAGVTKDSVIQFEKGLFDEVNRIAAMIREMAAGKKHPTSAPNQIDIPEQIRKLASLKNDGILSAEEFDAKKRELLAKL